VVDVTLGVGVRGDKEALAQFAALNREIASLYGTGLNLRRPAEAAGHLSKSLNVVGREIRDIVAPAIAGLGISLGMGAGGLALSLVGIGRVSREFAQRTVEMRHLAAEAGQNIEQLRGFAAASEGQGISNDAAVGALQSFGRKADDMRRNLGELRAELTGWGEGELVARIQASADNGEALEATLRRMDELREVAPLRARAISEMLLGDYKFMNVALKDVKRWASQASAPSKRALEVAAMYNRAMVEMDHAFGDVKEAIGAAVLPGWTTALNNLSKLYADDPHALDPLVKGIQDAGVSIARITAADWAGTGRFLGTAVLQTLKGLKAVYSALEWASDYLGYSKGAKERQAVREIDTVTAKGREDAERDAAKRTSTATDQVEAVDKQATKTKGLLSEIVDRLFGKPGGHGVPAVGGGGTGERFGLGAGYGTPGGFRGKPSGPQGALTPGGGGPGTPAGGDPGGVRQRTGGGGNVEPHAYYKMMTEKFRQSKLNGYVPPDGEKWGIKTGSPEEWAALSVAVAQQESGMNRNAPGGGLNQFGPNDLARYGQGGKDVSDPEAQGQALVNQFERYITRDKVIAGFNDKGKWGGATAYFGSMRRKGEADKYIDWAGAIRRESEARDAAAQGKRFDAEDRNAASAKASSDKLDINVKIKGPRSGIDVQTNSAGDGIGTVTTQRQIKQPDTPASGGVAPKSERTPEEMGF
jgi:hypothetical protein